jgi:hypothetical protein
MTKQIDEWQKTAARYRSEPETRPGTTELVERVMEAEHEGDTALARYHNYEIASAAFQIGIVLCSAAVIIAMLLLAWTAGGVAIFGILLPRWDCLLPMHFILASSKGKAKHNRASSKLEV